MIARNSKFGHVRWPLLALNIFLWCNKIKTTVFYMCTLMRFNTDSPQWGSFACCFVHWISLHRKTTWFRMINSHKNEIVQWIRRFCFLFVSVVRHIFHATGCLMLSRNDHTLYEIQLQNIGANNGQHCELTNQKKPLSHSIRNDKLDFSTLHTKPFFQSQMAFHKKSTKCNFMNQIFTLL